MVTYSRPGYGTSTPYRWTDGAPRIVDDVADSVAILDHLGTAEFVTLGWSGGGPRALACGAELPDRCLAVATLAGVAPKDGAGLDWFDGMAPENRAEYAAAEQGADAYAAYLTEEFLPIMQMSAEDMVAGMGGLLTPVDAAAFTDELGDYLARSMHHAGAQGVVGARDDGAGRDRGPGASTSARSGCRSPSGRGVRTRWSPSRTASGWPRTCPAPRRTSSTRRATCRWRSGSRRSSPTSGGWPVADRGDPRGDGVAEGPVAGRGQVQAVVEVGQREAGGADVRHVVLPGERGEQRVHVGYGGRARRRARRADHARPGGRRAPASAGRSRSVIAASVWS